jgi:hypothetical protein
MEEIEALKFSCDVFRGMQLSNVIRAWIELSLKIGLLSVVLASFPLL